MNRSLYKGPYVQASLVDKIRKLRQSCDITKISIKTYSRRSTILPSFVGLTFDIHNGKKFIKVLVTDIMIGKKLGEFAYTRIYAKHTNKKDDLKNKKGVRKRKK